MSQAKELFRNQLQDNSSSTDENREIPISFDTFLLSFSSDRAPTLNACNTKR